MASHHDRCLSTVTSNRPDTPADRALRQRRGHTKIRAVNVKPLNEWYQKTAIVENEVGDLFLLEPCRAAARVRG